MLKGEQVQISKRGVLAGGTAVGLMFISACGGSVGASAGTAEQGEGVEYGASKEEYIEALADMEPVELKLSGSGSASGHTAERELAFAESVEEWSGGKITFDVMFGQPVAPYGEITEAVSDGRLDLGLEVPVYTPEEYPATNDLGILSTQAASGPLFAEMVSMAAVQDFASNNETILDEYREKGVEPLIPAEIEFSNALLCTEPIESTEDFNGKQVRAGSSIAFDLMGAMGASGVSLQVTETYEALQRNTVDCSLTALKSAAPQGISEAAPHVTFPTATSFGRSPTAWVTGPRVAQLPLAARQLIFDRLATWLGEGIEANVNWTIDALGIVEEQGGGIYRLEDAADAALSEAVTEAMNEDALEVLDPGEATAELQTKIDKWTAIAEEEGFTEFDSWEDLANSAKDTPIDFDSFSKRMYEEIYLQHRPS
jgi:TRAP-type C4-dicarboxylate transport system substrate-binding protein